MYKKLILLPLIFLVFISCQDEIKILEPKVFADSIEFPFESRKNGKFMTIFRNNTNESISFSLIMVKQGEVLKDSQKIDFCPDVNNIKKNIVLPDWFMVNFNIAVVPESSVGNPNDHPNLVSYALPKGTYLLINMDTEECNNNTYEVFDITTNEAMGG